MQSLNNFQVSLVHSSTNSNHPAIFCQIYYSAYESEINNYLVVKSLTFNK